MQHKNRVLYREGLHIFMDMRLIKLILAKQVVETNNTLIYLRAGPNAVAITMRCQESINYVILGQSNNYIKKLHT